MSQGLPPTLSDFPIVDRFQDLKLRSPTQANGPCPAHDDDRDSFGVAVGDNGKLLLKCFAGCELSDILRAVGGKFSDLYPLSKQITSGNGNRSGHHGHHHSSNVSGGGGSGGGVRSSASNQQKRRKSRSLSRSKIVATYDFTDATGKLLFQEVRTEPKNFFLRQPKPDLTHAPDPANRDDWINSINNPPVAPVLYRLPELLSSPVDAPVFLLEGPKKAKVLASQRNSRGEHFIATSTPGGCDTWHKNFSDALIGRHVFIIRDNDPINPKSGNRPGELRVRRLAHDLSGIAAFVAELVLPPIGKLLPRDEIATPAQKWDLIEWVQEKPPEGETHLSLFRKAYQQAAENPLVVSDGVSDLLVNSLGSGNDANEESRDSTHQGSTGSTGSGGGSSSATISPQPPAPLAPLPITNADEDPTTSALIPLTIPTIIERIFSHTDSWPRRIGTALFTHNPAIPDSPPHWIESASQLFAYIGHRARLCPLIHREPGCHPKEEIYAGLRQLATSYEAIEVVPHEPPIPTRYYACSFPDPAILDPSSTQFTADGTTLLSLIDRFCPATDDDYHLILAMFATVIWGGPGGQRPMFVITSDDGRGVGKSKMAGMVAHLAGGFISVSSNETAREMRERLLSPEGLTKRVALLDNVKTLRFSWAELESIITTESISGRRMYVGEGSRPNNITWLITLNGVSLSTDMAQRAIVVKVKRPTQSGDWESETRKFIDENRQQIIADLINFLRQPAQPLVRYTRWGTWESQVLSRLADPEKIQDLIISRQQSSDAEDEESHLIVEYFEERLQALGIHTRHTTDTFSADYTEAVDANGNGIVRPSQIVHIPSQLAAKWFTEATKEKRDTPAICRMMNQKISEGSLRGLILCEQRNKYGRGYLWIGDWPIKGIPKDEESGGKYPLVHVADLMERIRRFDRE